MRTILTAIIALLLLQDIAAQIVQQDVSAIYIGGHIRRERPATITRLRNSGFTTAILFNVHVDADGTLMTDGETICKDGKYVFDATQPYYISDVQKLKTAPTSICRIEICIGGWGNDSYDHIRDLINAHGTGEETTLYKNFKALKDAIPEIDAVNNDDEQCYDSPTAVKFHTMMNTLGYTTTLAPYTNKTFWQRLANGLKDLGCVDRIMIQCYDGGAGNNPSQWQLLDAVPVYAGRMYYQDTWDVDYHIGKYQEWADNNGVTGGFVWVYNDESWDLNAWAAGINRVFKARSASDDLIAATVFSQTDYGGYSVKLPVGTYKPAEMACWGIATNDIASAKVNNGYKLTVYTNSICGGRGSTYQGDNADLGTYADRAQSLKVEPIEDAIADIESDQQPTAVHDLQGRKVNPETNNHGIYIINNKKIIK